MEYQGRELAARFLTATASGARISAMTRFDAGTLPWFGLPVTLLG